VLDLAVEWSASPLVDEFMHEQAIEEATAKAEAAQAKRRK
jgi:hypothetical protein